MAAAHSVAPDIQGAILFLPRVESVRVGRGQGDRGAADRSGDGLGCAAGDVGRDLYISSMVSRLNFAGGLEFGWESQRTD